MDALAKYRPVLASVLDWEHDEQLSEVLEWAEEAAQYVSEVIIIPKVIDGIKRLPRTINSKPIRLGYSVPTKFGATTTPIEEFRQWPVHLLGGSLNDQFKCARSVDVQSADGNYMQRLAIWNMVYSPSVPSRQIWPTLTEMCERQPHGSIYLSFELSCIAIPMAWHGETGTAIYDAQMAWLESQGLAPAKRQLRLF